MILLDTNVVSEPLRQHPSDHVVEWIDAQPLETLSLSAITVAELRAGVAMLPAGKRRTALQEGLEKRVLPMFAGRVRPFNVDCTAVWAELMTQSRAAGAAISMADSLIAAIAVSNGFIVATRDTAPFLAAGVDVINPWERE